MPHPDDPPRANVGTIREGDQFVYQGTVRWTALSDAAEDEDGTVDIVVRYPDGGVSERTWPEPCEIPIRRAT